MSERCTHVATAAEPWAVLSVAPPSTRTVLFELSGTTEAQRIVEHCFGQALPVRFVPDGIGDSGIMVEIDVSSLPESAIAEFAARVTA